MYLLEDVTHWKSILSEGVLCFSAKSLKYLFVKSLNHIFFGKIIAESMAEDILHRRLLELSTNNLDFDQNIIDQALFELNKEVESLSGKSIKEFGFTLPLNFNLNATINTGYTRNKL